MKVYRITVQGVGVFMAAKMEPRFKEFETELNAMDWFPQVGEMYPGAVSFWTEEGYHKYQETGLKEIHKKIIGEHKLHLTVLDLHEDEPSIVYRDELQIIVQH